MRWAICRARTQVKTWTRMLCSVQWCMGEKDTTRVSLICRKENSASDWDRYPATTSGTGQSSWPVIRTCLPKISSSSAARASGVDAPGQAQVLGLVAGQLPGDDAADPGLGGDRLDLGVDLVLAAAGLAAGQGSGQFVQLLAGLGQGGAVEPACLALVQFRGVGQDGAPLGRRRPRGGCRRRSARRTGPYRRRIACWQAGRSGPGSPRRAPTRCSAARCRPGGRSWPRCSARRRRPRSCPPPQPGPRPCRRPPGTGRAAGRSWRGTG